MNVSDLIQTYFGDVAAEHLGRAAGIDAQTAQRALGLVLPMQFDALADHAATSQGQSQIADALQNLPQFSSVQSALSTTDGAMNLQRAGELLAPALLGGQQDRILSALSGQLGGAPTGELQKLMQMALPLLLSFLGQRGLNAGNIGSILPGMKGGLGGMLGAGAAVLGANALGAKDGLSGSLNASGLLDFLKGQFSGAAGEKIGTAAGFGGSVAGRAAMAALPLILNGIAHKGRTETGAHDVMSLAQGFSGLTDASGNLNLGFLNDNAEATRIEGQGRGLLGNLFGNVDEITGRLGSALGGSGSNAGRLLSLMAPLVLSLLGSRAKAANLNAGGLSGLLGGLSGGLAGLLPAGLTGLGALLGGGAAAAGTVTATTTPVTPARVTTPPVTPATPTPTPRPASTTTTAHTASVPVTTEKRGGFPWWLIPLALLLLLGGCWLTRPKDTTTTTSSTTTTTDTTTTDATGTDTTGTDATGTTDATDTTTETDTATTDTDTAPVSDGTFAFTEPTADTELPAGGFTMRGTGNPGDSVQLFEDGTSLGNVTVGDDGTWSYEVPSPTAGTHTYTAQGADGTELGSVAATIGAAEANAGGATCDKEYTLSITDGQTVTEPFRFGGVGQGEGYSVTVKRGERIIGTKNIPLDASCGWSYNSKPGKGDVTYEVRPMGDMAAEPLSTVNLTVNQ